MEELIDLIATDESPATISNKIKELIFSKAADRVDDARPHIAASMFGETEDDESEYDDEGETEEDENHPEDQE